MRKALLIFQVIFSLFILSFSSCVNHDFDLTDEKLDKNAVFSDSINLPIGNIEKILIFDEIAKVYNGEIKSGAGNILFIEYAGSFSVEFPKYEVPTVDKLSSLSSINDLNGTVILPPFQEIPFISEMKATYEVERPKLVDENSLTITPQKVAFSSFIIKAGFELPGITFNSVADDAAVTVSLTFPSNYVLKNATVGNTIEKPVKVKDIATGQYCSLGEIEVSSYTFTEGESELTYNVVLGKSSSPIQLTATDPGFKLILEPENGKIAVSYLECLIGGTKTFEGTESGFGDLQNAFGEGDILEFKDPSVAIDLTTNLGTEFKLGVKMSNNVVEASLRNPLEFKKPAEGATQSTSYVLTPKDPVTLPYVTFENFDKIVSTPFPEELSYATSLIFDNTEAKLLSPDQLTVEANYTFNIPFDFNKIDLSIKDTLTDLFSEDLYDQVFKYTTKEVSIAADKVDVSIGNIDLVISAVILDADYKEIINLGSVLRDETPNLFITIKKEDIEKMKTARHLSFIFQLKGEGAITKDDYIKIDGVRLISGSGIYFEL